MVSMPRASSTRKGRRGVVSAYYESRSERYCRSHNSIFNSELLQCVSFKLMTHRGVFCWYFKNVLVKL